MLLSIWATHEVPPWKIVWMLLLNKGLLRHLIIWNTLHFKALPWIWFSKLKGPALPEKGCSWWQAWTLCKCVRVHITMRMGCAIYLVENQSKPQPFSITKTCNQCRGPGKDKKSRLFRPKKNDQKKYNTSQNFWHFEKQSVEIIYIYIYCIYIYIYIYIYLFIYLYLYSFLYTRYVNIWTYFFNRDTHAHTPLCTIQV